LFINLPKKLAMKPRICKMIFSTILFFFFSCASKQNIQTQFPEKIAATYFQHWIGGQELTGRGIYFYIQFEKSINANIQLEKVYFRGNEAVLNNENQTLFKANFKENNQIENALKMNKYNFQLNENQALLTYKMHNKTFYYKLENLKEKELIAYPSVGKPRK
jgi:hypothetical protein